MTLETGKEMDRRCVLGWLSEVYRHPTVAFNTYSDEQQIEFAHDALVLLKEQEAYIEHLEEMNEKYGYINIVRCKDCRHRGTMHCYCNSWQIKDDWFCADGVRRE